MMHRLRRFLLVWIVLGLGLPLPPLHIAGAPLSEITYEQTKDYRFAQQIVFALKASGDEPIESARLILRADGRTFDPLPAEFTPALSIDAQVSMGLRGGVLPPFSSVTFWWELRDASGAITETEHVSFDYVDNRYAWQQLSKQGVSVFWSQGDGAFAESVLETALAALLRIGAEIGVSRPDRIDIYVYPSQDDLIGALRLGGRDWAGGQARPELGVVLVDLAPNETAPVEMQRAIPHELTHLLVYQAAQPEYDHVPAWLDEGLATANETSPDSSQTLALDAAVSDDRLLPFERLCAPFPDDASQAVLAYAQSGSLIQFIRNRYGRQGIQDLLSAYRDKADCAAGVERALHLTLPALESQWRAQFATGSQAVNAAADAGAPWLALFVIFGLALLPMLGGLSKLRKTP